MARRRNVLETGERTDAAKTVIELPELQDVRGLCWADHPDLKAEVEDIWRCYLRALLRPVVALPVADVIGAFEKARSKTVAFRRELVHTHLLTANSEERRLLRAAAGGASVSDMSEKNSNDSPLENLDAARAQLAEALHLFDMAQGQVIARLQTAESSDHTDKELRDIARRQIADAFCTAGIDATTDRNGPLVLTLMQLEGYDSEAPDNDKRRRYFSSELARVLKLGS